MVLSGEFFKVKMVLNYGIKMERTIFGTDAADAEKVADFLYSDLGLISIEVYEND